MIERWLATAEIPQSWLPAVTQAAMIVAVLAVAWLSYVFCHRILAAVVRRITLRTEATWDDELLNDNVLRAGSQLVPAIVVSFALPSAFDNDAGSLFWIGKLCGLYIVFASVRLLCVFIGAAFDMLDSRERFHAYPLRGTSQMLRLVVIIIGVIVGLSVMLSRDPLLILSGFGASAAVMGLVFKDVILGMVAGVQLSANNMLKKGDWIIAPRFDANGEVIEMTLTTVKVRNWDNSVSTIPPYSLVSDSFQNWQAMRSSGVRRVSRSVYIDVNTVRFCTPDEIGRLRDRGMIGASEADQAVAVVNLRLFRNYVERYLASHPMVDGSSLIMVRQLQPTPSGLPVELYFFTDTVDWKEYEHIQADVFDHVYASVAEFGMRIFQTPAGIDLAGVMKR